MPHRQTRTRTIVEQGELAVDVDPQRRSGRILRQGEMEASYVDLADPTHLGFDYLRWLRIVVRAAGARRVLHVGGGACALARALAAEDPQGRQEVCEVDAAVLAIAREHLGLRRTPGLKVRHIDGRRFVAEQPDDSWHAIVIDAFVGARVPAGLVSAEALRDASRVAPLTAVNIVDDRAGHDVTAAAAAMAVAYPRVWTVGQRPGNKLVVGCTVDAQPDLVHVAAQAAADPSPARLTPPAQIARMIAQQGF